MPVTTVTKDPDQLTLTIVADFPVPVRRLWDAYSDPRQIERFWGPPEWPATFTRHDMAAGGRSNYYMTGPEGDQAHGYWEFTDVRPGQSFEVVDGFANPDGTPNDDLPTTRVVFSFADAGEGSRQVSTSHFDTAEQLQTLLDMGMEEGTTAAMGQIEDVLSDLRTFADDLPTQSQLIGDDKVRISRVIRGTADQVWAAHHDEELMKRWLLGPDGWTMPVCEVGRNVGDSFRYEWVDANGENRFGFTGELL